MAKILLDQFYKANRGITVAEKLEVTKERVLAAASKCSDAAVVLKELFPEAFAVAPAELSGELIVKHGYSIHKVLVRISGQYKDIGFYLPTDGLSWQIVKDASGHSVLVPSIR